MDLFTTVINCKDTGRVLLPPKRVPKRKIDWDLRNGSYDFTLPRLRAVPPYQRIPSRSESKKKGKEKRKDREKERKIGQKNIRSASFELFQQCTDASSANEKQATNHNTVRIFCNWLITGYQCSPGGVRTPIALHCGSSIFNMAVKAAEFGKL